MHIKPASPLLKVAPIPDKDIHVIAKRRTVLSAASIRSYPKWANESIQSVPRAAGHCRPLGIKSRNIDQFDSASMASVQIKWSTEWYHVRWWAVVSSLVRIVLSGKLLRPQDVDFSLRLNIFIHRFSFASYFFQAEISRFCVADPGLEMETLSYETARSIRRTKRGEAEIQK